MAVYADGIVIGGLHDSLIKEVKDEFNKRFKMKDMGLLQYVLGTRVDQDLVNKTITLSQKTYIKQMLEKFKLLDCKPHTTPMDGRLRLTKSQSPTTPEGRKEIEQVPYREAVGALLW